MLPALGVLLVAYTDFILTARAFTDRTDKTATLDADQEFLAPGAANLGAGLVHGFPVSGSASRTALAASAGARSQAYSLVAGAVLPAVPLFLSPSAVPYTGRRTRRARRVRRRPPDRPGRLPQARVLPAP